jgi:hypothetical protein
MNIKEGYYISYDGISAVFNETNYQLGINNVYCYSNDGINCYQTYG